MIWHFLLPSERRLEDFIRGKAGARACGLNVISVVESLGAVLATDSKARRIEMAGAYAVGRASGIGQADVKSVKEGLRESQHCRSRMDFTYPSDWFKVGC